MLRDIRFLKRLKGNLPELTYDEIVDTWLGDHTPTAVDHMTLEFSEKAAAPKRKRAAKPKPD